MRIAPLLAALWFLAAACAPPPEKRATSTEEPEEPPPPPPRRDAAPPKMDPEPVAPEPDLAARSPDLVASVPDAVGAPAVGGDARSADGLATVAGLGCAAAAVCDDFEDGNLDGWSVRPSGGSLQVNTAHAFSGKSALRVL